VNKGKAKEAISEIGDRLGLGPFRTEFKEFLGLQGLHKEFCDGASWQAFLYHYAGVIQDCPLVCHATALPSWHFDEVVLVGEPEEVVEVGKVRIHWQFLLKGQPIGVWFAHA
jgi:hypothetical protein